MRFIDTVFKRKDFDSLFKQKGFSIKGILDGFRDRQSGNFTRAFERSVELRLSQHWGQGNPGNGLRFVSRAVALKANETWNTDRVSEVFGTDNVWIDPRFNFARDMPTLGFKPNRVFRVALCVQTVRQAEANKPRDRFSVEEWTNLLNATSSQSKFAYPQDVLTALSKTDLADNITSAYTIWYSDDPSDKGWWFLSFGKNGCKNRYLRISHVVHHPKNGRHENDDTMFISPR